MSEATENINLASKSSEEIEHDEKGSDIASSDEESKNGKTVSS
jgi:hypothetical protein